MQKIVIILLLFGQVLSAQINRWTFERQWEDDIGSNNLTGSNAYIAIGGKEKNYCLYLGKDGANAYANAGTINFTTTFTISAWCYYNGSRANSNVVISEIRAGTDYGFTIYINSYSSTDRKIRVEFDEAGATDHWYSVNNNVVPVNTWFHLAMTYDKGTFTGHIYIDGTEVSMAGTINNNFDVSGPTHIGKYANSAFGYYGGYIDDIRIYNNILSESEIQEIAIANYKQNIDLYTKTLYHQDFENDTVGWLKIQDRNHDFNTPTSYTRADSVYIYEWGGERGKVLRVHYYPGAPGMTYGGFQIFMPFNTGTYDEVYLAYKIYFKDGFDWVNGIKSLGIGTYGTGAHAGEWPEGCCDDNYEGYSIGIMASGSTENPDSGFVHGYVYDRDRVICYGRGTCVDDSPFFGSGEWVQVVMRVTTNNTTASLQELWINDSLWGRSTSLRYETAYVGNISILNLYSFFGGSDPGDAPAKYEETYFDDIDIFVIDAINYPDLPVLYEQWDEDFVPVPEYTQTQTGNTKKYRGQYMILYKNGINMTYKTYKDGILK